ncbi:hypothetical protein [Galenea microaerophila]
MDFLSSLMAASPDFDLRVITVGTALFVFLFTRYVLFRLPLSFFWVTLIELPGTILHECLGHYLVSLLLNGRPIRCSVLPTKSEDGGWRLGYVVSSNITWYNAVPIAMAPLIIFIPALLFPPSNIGSALFWGLVMSSGIPSLTDFKVAFSNIFSVIFYGFLLYFLFFLP